MIDADADPDRRAWHRALATQSTDESVAAELQSSADRAGQRGGLAAEAALLERAVILTPDPLRRGERALAAARAKLRAGVLDEALSLLAVAETSPLSEADQARAALLHAQCQFSTDRGQDAAPLLLAAAQQLESVDPELSRETYLEAISAAMFAGRLADGANRRRVALSARSGPPSGTPPTSGDRLLDALTIRFTDGYQSSVPTVQSMLRSFTAAQLTRDDLHCLWLAAAAAADLWDDKSWRLVAGEHVRIARETGSLNELPLALNSRAVVHLHSGELGAAASLVAEIPTVLESTGARLASYAAMALVALRGDEGSARTLIETNLADVVVRGEGVGLAMCHSASALLDLGLGNPSAALVAATEAASDLDELAIPKWALSDLIEAAVLAGERDAAVQAFERLTSFTTASRTDWALGIEARGRALLSDALDDAASWYKESISRLGRTRMSTELARAHLLYGERLQGAGRRGDARIELETAHDMFSTMGASGFAGRARRALRAVGATVRPHHPGASETLTSQE
ncbi:MAG TPA: LuxR family transcriptional regulator, partial [Mycobacterium sp.]